MHKVYLVEPKYSYDGKGLVAADSAVQANEIIDDFIRLDNSNVLDSWGYNHVGECDCVEHLYSDFDRACQLRMSTPHFILGRYVS